MASESALPVSSTVGAPMAAKYPSYLAASPVAPRTALCAPPPEWPKLNMKDYISDYFRFDDIAEAFEKLENREIRKKGIIVYG